jgi:hypothetical protein
MRAEGLTLPPERDLPAGELPRRKRHLISEARRDGRSGWALRPAALAAALALAAVLSIPALGVVGSVTSWVSGWRDPESPVPVASDFVVASGAAGAPWRIVATQTDQGLCLFLLTSETSGFGGCGPRGIPPHSIGALGYGAGSSQLDQSFAFGPLAAEVASVELVLTEGPPVQAHVVDGSKRFGGVGKFYWASWPCGSLRCADAAGPMIELAIARDAAGRVLERRVPSWNGNPTGDPDGQAPPKPS